MSAAAAATDLFDFDLEYCGGGEMAGSDEAGRGCLAGPLVAAAVVFDYSVGAGRFGQLDGRLDDSKKLSAAVREELFPVIISAASRFAVVMASNHPIDEQGLHRTNLNLLERSLTSLDPPPALCLVDGYHIPDSTIEHQMLRKGDTKSACVAAASVLAKVVRDRLMLQLHQRFPEYGFDHHVGYATKAHRLAIVSHGLCRYHRRSFKINIMPGGGKQD
jgi:ribonuclease HII